MHCPAPLCCKGSAALFALQEEDLLTSFPAFHTYDREGLSAGLRFYRADQLPPALLDWALALTGRHMRALYEASPDWGWSDTRKRAELAHPDARYIVATTTAGAGPAAAAADPAADPAAPSSTGEGQPLAFLQFRFEEEAGDAVLYLYEIQVEAAAQGKGLGFFLMRLLELLAWKSGVSRVMLTVFHANQVAVRLYCKLGFVPDESSPEQHGEAAT